MSEPALGTIFTFYSYKGGTGRTMALANVAWILASRGKRVLVIDWDVEAPGLHRYFAPFLSDPTLSETDGLIEFLAQYVVSVTKELPEGEKSEEGWYRPYADIKRYAEPLQWQFPDHGGIDLVGAGRQNASYGARVNGFNWDAFYRQFGGGAFLDESIRQMKSAYDYVLIDSRTGISDTSGICTIHLPDALVVLYTLNNQSIEGASSVTANIIANRKGRSGEPFRVWSMATRIELSEKAKLEARRLFARERFSPFLETLLGLEGQQNEDYWGEMEILYDPFYAYDEVLAAIADLPGRTNSVLAAIERLTARITKGKVSRIGAMSEAKRREALALYARLGTTKTAPSVEQARRPNAWDIFISAGPTNNKEAERLYYLLGSNYKVFYAPKEIALGDSLKESITDALEHSRAMLLLVSRDSARSEWMNAEIQAARNRYEHDPSFKIIPVRLDATAVPTDKFLERFHSLTAQDGDVQDVAAQIRNSFDASSGGDSERDRNARIKVELDEALKQGARLRELVEAKERALLEAERLEARERKRTRRLSAVVGTLVLLLALVGVGWSTQDFLREQYYWLWAMGPSVLTAEQEKEKAAKPGSDFKECATGCPTMVVVRAGKFTMGSPESEEGRSNDEGPQHEVTIAKPFAIGKTEVTFAEWDACVAVNACPKAPDGTWGRGDRPVINVSWDDATQYARWLSRITGKEYRLLSEAEWEYAARAGSSGRYGRLQILSQESVHTEGQQQTQIGGHLDHGRYIPFSKATPGSQEQLSFTDNDEQLGNYAWYRRNSGGMTHRVATRLPNVFGPYDMYGNVWEWVADTWHASYEGAPADGSAWVGGDASWRVVRGGAWNSEPRELRPANRHKKTIGNRDDDLGFRLARTLKP
jgi:formylglycine-generating enzyme required for sulfatase activity/MinD-like ATPase involved in chromosome partitioning or flagellar assembly